MRRKSLLRPFDEAARWSARLSVVGAGTEWPLLEMAKKSPVGKALVRLDLVRRVPQKARTDGVTKRLPGRREEPRLRVSMIPGGGKVCCRLLGGTNVFLW